MTTVEDATEAEIAVRSTPIKTEHGTFALNDLAEIADVPGKARVAAAITRETKRLADSARHLRDIGGLLMNEPFAKVQRPHDAEIAKIEAAVTAGKITSAVAHERRIVQDALRRERMIGVPYQPIDVYRDTIGVSRGLFARMTRREPQLPTIEEYIAEATDEVPLPEATLATVEKIAKQKRVECEMYDAINKIARGIRDDAIMLLLRGDKKTGLQPLSNADIARLTGLTAPRIHQLAYGIR